MGNRIMTHLIAGYPTAEIAVACAEGLASGGAAYLEVQFPFSDPSADGPVIQKACQIALDSGFSVESGFQQIRRIREYTDCPIFVMSYASVPYAAGIDTFLTKVKEAGANGVIIPDLMPGYDEGLYEKASQRQVEAIPVVAPGISDTRLEQICTTPSAYVYTALRTGITGNATDLNETTVLYLDRISKLGKMVLAGFGLTSRAQVERVGSLVHATVIGSELVRTLNRYIEAPDGELIESVRRGMKQKIQELTGA